MHTQRMACIKDNGWVERGGLIELLEHEHDVKGKLLHFISDQLVQYRVGVKELSDTVAKRVERLQGPPACPCALMQP